MDNATFVFECLLRDSVYMEKIDMIIHTFICSEFIRYQYVPKLVKSLIDIISSRLLQKPAKTNWCQRSTLKEFKLTAEDAKILLYLYRKYILDKIKGEDMYVNDFTSIYNTCVSLVLTQLTFAKNNKRTLKGTHLP